MASETGKSIFFAVEPELHKKLRLYCVKNNTSIKKLLNQLIEKELNSKG